MRKTYVLAVSWSGQVTQYSVAQMSNQALRIRAVPGAKYELADLVDRVSPTKIRVAREGNHLLVYLPEAADAPAAPNIRIEEFFVYADSALYGVGSDGAAYPYVVANGDGHLGVAQLGEGMSREMWLMQEPVSAAVSLPLLSPPLIAGGGVVVLATAGSGGDASAVHEQQDEMQALKEGRPTLAQLASLGVSGVNESNLAAIHSALSLAAMDGHAVDSVARAQSIVDAYNRILSDASKTVSDYLTIGADIGEAATDTENLALLNDIVGACERAGIDTVSEISELARIANAIQQVAAGQTPLPALSVTDLIRIGLDTTGVTPNNLPALLAAIAAQNDNGSDTDSLSKLQALVNNLDKIPPSAPVSAPAIHNAAGATATDDTTPSLFVGTGLSETPTLYVDGVRVRATYNSVAGTLTPDLALSGVGDGTAGVRYTLAYTLSDAAGNESGLSPALTLTIDTVNDAPTGGVGVSGTPKVGQTLTATHQLVDPDGPIGHLAYQWQVNNNGTWTDISGATADTYTLSVEQLGKQVRAVATYNDGIFSNTVTSSASTSVLSAAPVFTSGTTASVDENAAVATVVYHAQADGDGGMAYSLLGADAGAFNINSSTGEVTMKVSADFENPNDAGADKVYNITVRATNVAGDSTDQAVTVGVVDVNEAPVIDLSGYVIDTNLSELVLWGGGAQANTISSYSTNSNTIDFSSGASVAGKAQIEVVFHVNDYLFGVHAGVDYSAPAVWGIYVTGTDGVDTLYATVTSSPRGYDNGAGRFTVTYANGASGTLNGTSATQGDIANIWNTSQPTSDNNVYGDHFYTLLMDLPATVVDSGAVKFTYNTQGSDGLGTGSRSDDTVWISDVRVYNGVGLPQIDPSDIAWIASDNVWIDSPGPAGAVVMSYTDPGSNQLVHINMVAVVGSNNWDWQLPPGVNVPEGVALTAVAISSYSGHYAYWTEGDAPVAVVSPNMSIVDADASSRLESATVKLSNAVEGDRLTLNHVALADGATGVLSVNGAELSYSAAFGTGSVTLTLTGTSSAATYRAALQQIGYSNTSESPDSSVERNIEVTVNDGTNDSNTAVCTIAVHQLNDQPLAVLSTVALATAIDDPLSQAGQTVGSLFGSAFSDADGDALAGVMVTGNAATATQGSWQWHNGSNWIAIATSTSLSSALWLNSGTLLRFAPAAEFDGTFGELTVRLADSTVRDLASGSVRNIDASVPSAWGWDGPSDALSTSSVSVHWVL